MSEYGAGPYEPWPYPRAESVSYDAACRLEWFDPGPRPSYTGRGCLAAVRRLTCRLDLPVEFGVLALRRLAICAPGGNAADRFSIGTDAVALTSSLIVAVSFSPVSGCPMSEGGAASADPLGVTEGNCATNVPCSCVSPRGASAGCANRSTSCSIPFSWPAFDCCGASASRGAAETVSWPSAETGGNGSETAESRLAGSRWLEPMRTGRRSRPASLVSQSPQPPPSDLPPNPASRPLRFRRRYSTRRRRSRVRFRDRRA